MMFLPKIKAVCVFCPGLAVPPVIIKSSWRIWWAFRSRGYDLKIAMMPLAGSVEERAHTLWELINRMKIESDIHLVGHSLGGIDARRMISLSPVIAKKIISLTTISAPHRGSPIADKFVKGELPEDASDFKQATHALTTAAMMKFNETVLDDANVKYYSMGFDLERPWCFLSPGWQICSQAGFPINDGMVPALSASWGTYLGTFKGAHIPQVNPIRVRGKYVWPETFAAIMDNLDREFYK